MHPLAAAARHQSAGHRSSPDCYRNPFVGWSYSLGSQEESKEGQWDYFHSMVEQREHQHIEQAHVLAVALQRPIQSRDRGSDLAYGDGVR